MTDISQDVDRELKKACEDLILQCTQVTTLPLRTFLDKSAAYLSTRPANSSDLPSQSFATVEKMMEVHDEFRKTVQEGIEAWKARLLLYLQDGETVRVLVPPAQVRPSSVTRVNELNLIGRITLLISIDSFMISLGRSMTFRQLRGS
jgi:hypothetical protein